MKEKMTAGLSGWRNRYGKRQNGFYKILFLTDNVAFSVVYTI